MKNSQTVIRSILGTADVDIRPLAYAVDAAVELMFRQGIPEDDIAVTKELYAKAAERLPKGKKGKRSVKTVTKQIQRVANACWDTLVREGMVEHHLGRPRKTIPAPREMIFYLASQAYWEIPYFQAMEEGKLLSALCAEGVFRLVFRHWTAWRKEDSIPKSQRREYSTLR